LIRKGEEWRQSFEHATRFGWDPVLPQPEQLEDGIDHGNVRNSNFFHAISVLLERQRNILMADPLNLTFLVAQPLIIGALIGWVAENPVLRMFLGVVATLWFGCSNGAQQIVRELPIFRRERVSGLGVNAYLQSKYLFLSAVTAAQALILYVVTSLQRSAGLGLVAWDNQPRQRSSPGRCRTDSRARHRV